MGTTDYIYGACGWNIDDVTFTATPTCFGDLDGDNYVGLGDLSVLLANYGTTTGAGYQDGDLDNEGDVDLADLSALLAIYGTTCE